MSTRRSFTKTKLSLPGARSHSGLPSSMPLIIPNNRTYDIHSNELRIDQGKQRTALKIVPDTLELLRSIKRPVGVLSICGPCRSGKSYILSRLLGSSDAFALGHTMDSKTFGIWIGTTVLECDEFTLILMDSEGVDSTAAEERNDATILVLSVLLSSCLIYNSFGVPKHGDLTRMNQFVKLAESVIVSTNDEQGSNLMELKQHFPDFLWLLRDAHLTPTGEDGREISPKDYILTKVLRHGPPAIREKEDDVVGRVITTVFPSIECRAIQAPSTDRTVMLNIAANIKRLDPQFNKEVEEVVQYIYSAVKPKRGAVAGTRVDGVTLAELTTKYIDAVNNPDAIPCIKDTWSAAIDRVCKDCMDQMVKEYDKEVEDMIGRVGMPMEEEALNPDDTSGIRTLFAIHRSVLLHKTSTLLNKVGHFLHTSNDSPTVLTRDALCAEFEHLTAVFSSDKRQTAKHKKVTGGILMKYAMQNYEASLTSCRSLFDELYRPIKSKIENSINTYTFENLIQDLSGLYDAYFRRAIGPAKWEVYDEKQSFIEQQKSVYQTLKGFQIEAMENAQIVALTASDSERMNDLISKLQTQLEKEAEFHKETIREVMKKNEEEQARLRKELKERAKRDQSKYEELMKANMEALATMNRESNEQHTRLVEAMMKLVENSQDKLESLNKDMAAKAAQEVQAVEKERPDSSFLTSVISLVPSLVGAVSKCTLM